MFGKILFVSQLFAMILCALPLELRWPLPLTLFFMGSAGLLLGWVLAHNKLGNWSVLPQPKDDSQVVTRGPYGLMRHPMYSAVLLGGFGFVIHNQTLQSVIAFAFLIMVLNVKARYEEKLLKLKFPDYEQYVSSVKNRFLPKWL